MVEREKLREYVLKELAWEKEIDNFNDDYTLLENGIIDSLAMLKLISFIEEKYIVKLRDEDFVPDNFETINCMINMIVRRKNGSEPFKTDSESVQ